LTGLVAWAAGLASATLADPALPSGLASVWRSPRRPILPPLGPCVGLAFATSAGPALFGGVCVGAAVEGLGTTPARGGRWAAGCL